VERFPNEVVADWNLFLNFKEGSAATTCRPFFNFMAEQYFSPPVLFRTLLIVIENNEVLFYKNDDPVEFYYFNADMWHSNFKAHMADKNWFTKEMSDFITSNILP